MLQKRTRESGAKGFNIVSRVLFKSYSVKYLNSPKVFTAEREYILFKKKVIFKYLIFHPRRSSILIDVKFKGVEGNNDGKCQARREWVPFLQSLG